MSKIQTMLELQQQLNDATNGLDWESGITKNNKVIDWRRCIHLELAELIESYPWKHWKNIDAQPDYENIKIETVDIWHFIMSEALRVYKTESLGDIEKLAEDIVSMPTYQKFTTKQSVAALDNYEQIAVHEEMYRAIFCDKSIESIIAQFFKIASVANLGLDELYSLYIGKNILNQFRQDHGYKDGSYIKIWDGKEDNVIMQEILKNDANITPQHLYVELERHYDSL